MTQAISSPIVTSDATSGSGRPSVTVRLVECTADMDDVVCLRRSVCTGELWFDPAGDLLQDPTSYIWLAERDGRPVASARALPHTSGLTCSTTSCAPLHTLPVDDSWVEVGRLVADPVAGFMAAQLLFREAARWLLDNTSFRWAYGMCAPEMVPYYQRFGLTLSSETFQASFSDGQKTSHLLHGHLGDILNARRHMSRAAAHV